MTMSAKTRAACFVNCAAGPKQSSVKMWWHSKISLSENQSTAMTNSLQQTRELGLNPVL